MDVSCKTGYIVLCAAAFASVLFLLWSNTPTNEQPSEKNTLTYATTTVTVGTTTLVVDIADTQEKRDTGLSGRDNLGHNRGMLFVFEKPDTHSFWMKDMHFPIDIFWLNTHKEVVHIQRNARPDSYPASFSPLQPALYVLETNTGVLSHISFGQTMHIE